MSSIRSFMYNFVYILQTCLSYLLVWISPVIASCRQNQLMCHTWTWLCSYCSQPTVPDRDMITVCRDRRRGPQISHLICAQRIRLGGGLLCMRCAPELISPQGECQEIKLWCGWLALYTAVTNQCDGFNIDGPNLVAQANLKWNIQY